MEILAEGSLVFFLLIPPQEFRNISVTFLRRMGRKLNTILKIQVDKEGVEMIYEWQRDTESARKKRDIVSG